MAHHRKRMASFITEDGEEESPYTKHRRPDNCGGQGNEGRGNSSSHSRVSSKGKSRKRNKCCNKHRLSPSGSSSNASSTSCDQYKMPEARNNYSISSALPPVAMYSQDEIGESSLESHKLLTKEEDMFFYPGQELGIPVQLLTVEVQSEDIVTESADHENISPLPTISSGTIRSAELVNCQPATMGLDMPLISADELESPNVDVPIQLITTEVLSEQGPGLQEEISQASDSDLEGNDIFTELWLSPDVPIATSTVEVVTEEDQADSSHMITVDPEETVSEAPVLPSSEGDVPIQPVTVEVLTESFGMNSINQYFQVQDENAVIVNRSSLEEVPGSTYHDETYHDMLASGFTSGPPAQNISAGSYLEQRDRSRSDDGRRRGRSLRGSGRSLRRRRRPSARNLRLPTAHSDLEEEDREREGTDRDSGLGRLETGSSRIVEGREEVNIEQAGRETEIHSNLTRTTEDEEVRAVLSAIIELAREEGIPLQEFFEVEVQEEVEDSSRLTQSELDKLPVRNFGELDSDSPSSYKCSICLTEFEHGDAIRTLTSCVHEFHQTCIDEWLMTTNTCPLCRTVVTPH